MRFVERKGGWGGGIASRLRMGRAVKGRIKCARVAQGNMSRLYQVAYTQSSWITCTSVLSHPPHPPHRVCRSVLCACWHLIFQSTPRCSQRIRRSYIVSQLQLQRISNALPNRARAVARQSNASTQERERGRNVAATTHCRHKQFILLSKPN